MTGILLAQHIELSIVIPTYNYAHLIERSICSVTTQLEAGTELVVVDDGSTDDTSIRLAHLRPSLPDTVRFTKQENAGPAAARNYGLRLTNGKYLLFLDADDELLPGAISKILEVIRRRPDAGIILGARLDRFADGREKFVAPTPIKGSASERINAYLLKKRISIQHGACIFRRDFLEQRPYPEHLRQTEDLPVFAYLAAKAAPELLDQPIVRIHKHLDSLRHNAKFAREAHNKLAIEVFSQLPEECQHLRPSFEAKRALSVFRVCYQSSDWQQAKVYYHQALRADWPRALRWKYMSKYLRILIQGSKAG